MGSIQFLKRSFTGRILRLRYFSSLCFTPKTRTAIVHLNFRAGSIFPVPVLSTGLAGATRLTRSDIRLNLLLLKGQGCVKSKKEYRADFRETHIDYIKQNCTVHQKNKLIVRQIISGIFKICIFNFNNLF